MKKSVLFFIIISMGLLLVGCNEKKEENDKFEVIFANNDITPGNKLDIRKFSEDYEKSEVPNCAFGDKGIVYTFKDVEISTNEDYLIYSVYVLDPNYKTKEGISLGDSLSNVLKVYGKQDVKDGILKYTRDKVELVININNDVVDGIEYILMD